MKKIIKILVILLLFISCVSLLSSSKISNFIDQILDSSTTNEEPSENNDNKEDVNTIFLNETSVIF